MNNADNLLIKPFVDLKLVKKYSTILKISPVIIYLSIQRGYDTEEKIKSFLFPTLSSLEDPFKILGMNKVIDRLLLAIEKQQTVFIYGDYDVDGITSVAFLKKLLESYDIKVINFIPSRFSDGYGLNLNTINNYLSKYSDIELVIAVDCGTNDLESASFIKSKNIDLIILDHHELKSTEPAECFEIINEKNNFLSSLIDNHKVHDFCSVGIVFKVAHALLKCIPNSDFNLKNYLYLVALGTISDMVPLIGENRTLSKKGLLELFNTTDYGINELKSVCKINSTINSFDVSFKIAPRINAAGRLNSALPALELLTCKDNKRSKELAQFLNEENSKRRIIGMKIQEQAYEMIKSISKEDLQYGIVLYSREWNKGIVGIVASQISNNFYRTTFIIAIDKNGIGTGSARSIKEVSLIKILNDSRSLINSGGGHEMAAGITIDESNISKFYESLIQSVKNQIGDKTLISTTEVDMEIDFRGINSSLTKSYSLLEPFGMNNNKPIFMTTNVTPVDSPKLIKNYHLKFNLEQKGVKKNAIYFNSSKIKLPDPPWIIIFTLSLQEWKDVSFFNIIISDIREFRN